MWRVAGLTVSIALLTACAAIQNPYEEADKYEAPESVDMAGILYGATSIVITEAPIACFEGNPDAIPGMNECRWVPCPGGLAKLPRVTTEWVHGAVVASLGYTDTADTNKWAILAPGYTCRQSGGPEEPWAYTELTCPALRVAPPPDMFDCSTSLQDSTG